MKKFSVRTDMEGLSGVVQWNEAVPGSPAYENSRGILHQEIGALAQGLIEGGTDYVEIYDEHYYGLNLDVALLPAKTSVIRGKPPYTADWRGGLDSTFAGMILHGYHAMRGVEQGTLSHTYEPDIEAIWINGLKVGEIGVEAAIAGDVDVPLVLIIADEHGAEEAKALIPGVETVVTKFGRGAQVATCRNWPEVKEEIIVKAKRLAETPSKAAPLKFGPGVELRIKLFPGEYRKRFVQDHPWAFQGDDSTVVLCDTSVSVAWAKYWELKDDILAKIAKA